MFENYVFSELVKLGFEPRYWRTKSGAEVEGTEPQHELPSGVENGSQAPPEGRPASAFSDAASIEAPETTTDRLGPLDSQEATAAVSTAEERAPDIESETAASKVEGLGPDSSAGEPPTPEEGASPAEPNAQSSPQEGEL